MSMLKTPLPGDLIPEVQFIFREEGQFVTRSSFDIFNEKRVVIFGLPGAFTPTCSAYQLPGFEENYDEILELGIDEVYCTSVNDAFVMNAWAENQGIEKVKMLPDGNGSFAEGLGLLVEKKNLGFGSRSWRYAAVINNGVIEFMFVESGIEHNTGADSYVESEPEKVLRYLKQNKPN